MHHALRYVSVLAPPAKIFELELDVCAFLLLECLQLTAAMPKNELKLNITARNVRLSAALETHTQGSHVLSVLSGSIERHGYPYRVCCSCCH